MRASRSHGAVIVRPFIRSILMNPTKRVLITGYRRLVGALFAASIVMLVPVAFAFRCKTLTNLGRAEEAAAECRLVPTPWFGVGGELGHP